MKQHCIQKRSTESKNVFACIRQQVLYSGMNAQGSLGVNSYPKASVCINLYAILGRNKKMEGRAAAFGKSGDFAVPEEIGDKQVERKLFVCAKDNTYMERAGELAEHIGAEAKAGILDDASELVLCVDDRGLTLMGNGMQIRGDFGGLKKRIRTPALNGELLIKAAKIRTPAEDTPTALDATAGLGEDAFLLAAAGFLVDMYEKDPVIAALLEDALIRAKEDPDLAPAAARMILHEEDSLEAMKKKEKRPDVIYLDPMFPERKKSGLVGKKFQLLHLLEKPCTDEEVLLYAAVDAHPHKVVVKRPLKGPYLADMRPSFSVRGKAIRYDCIVL